LDRPNILLIHSDQHRYDCVAANGHPFVRTPNLDRVAAEGISFSHAFTPTPVCTPARNSLLYGVWPARHQAVANRGTEAGRPAVEGLPTFAQALAGAGYHLSYVGKWGIAGDPLQAGFHDYLPGQSYRAWRADQGLPPVPSEGGWLGGRDPHVTPEQSQVGWEAGHVIDRLRAVASASSPFFIRWDPYGPHLPNVVPEPYYSLYPPDSIPPWPSFPDPLQGKPFIQAQMRRTWGVDGWQWPDWAPLVSAYLAQITLMDAQIGRVLTELDDLGLAESTLVVYTCDHGDLCGGHGMIDKHHVMYDDVVHVPLILRWPAGADPGRVCEAFVSHELDLAATFCDMAGAPLPDTFQGSSLLPLLRGAPAPTRADIFSTYYGSQFGLYSSRMVRDRRWKYVWNATAEDELYDLLQDPAEIHNRAGDPSLREVAERLRHRLVAWMEETSDPLLNEWTRRLLLEGRTRP